jgi:protein-disulfide isomerase
MKQVSWVLALVVGVTIGFFAKSALVGGSAPAVRPAVAAPNPAAQRPPRPQEDPKAVYKVPVGDSPAKGPADALVTIVESSDFECPFCKRVVPTLKQLEQAYPGKLRFVFKHNPLPFHQSALPAALAAEEARAQKGDAGFWAMHDALFDASPALDAPGLERAAATVGLDVPKLRAAVEQKTHEPRIRRDQQLVTGLGATGTPAFFINGRKLTGAQPFENFRALVDEELKKAEALVASGTPAGGLYAAIIEKGAEAPVMLAGAPGQPAAPAAPPAPPATVYRKVSVRPDDPVRGPADAKLTVVLFSDFQCPFCARVEPTLKELEAAFPGQVRIVWKHQPLPFHPNARPAALAAEAAREQGKFWQMHEKMFANQAQLSPAAYEGWAKELGLDVGRFKASVAAARGEARIAEDQAQARQVGADGTPTMFFNCRQVVGALPMASMRPIVEEELKKADALLAKGVKKGPGFFGEACDANVAAAPAPAARAAAALPAVEAAPAKVDLRPDDPVKGNPKAPVTVVIFSDFQCPYCARVEPTLKQVEATYGDKVRIAWKHKPLPFHPNAMPAAEAAEAAREQGKFWPMHDKMFGAQQELSPAAYERWARELGLDVGRFKAAVASGKFKARIQEDDAQAGRLGIDGTPTMVINGEKVVGAVPFENLKAVIDRKLAAK